MASIAAPMQLLGGEPVALGDVDGSSGETPWHWPSFLALAQWVLVFLPLTRGVVDWEISRVGFARPNPCQRCCLIYPLIILPPVMGGIDGF